MFHSYVAINGAQKAGSDWIKWANVSVHMLVDIWLSYFDRKYKACLYEVTECTKLPKLWSSYEVYNKKRYVWALQ